jgi:hypothetical protein
VDISRMTTIPMPHRGKKAILRTRTKPSITKADPVPKSKFALMTPIDILKWGLDYKRNVKKGWLENLLVGEKLMEDTKAALKERFWSDYKAQCLFIQGMQAALGNEFDPRVSKQGRKEKFLRHPGSGMFTCFFVYCCPFLDSLNVSPRPMTIGAQRVLWRNI